MTWNATAMWIHNPYEVHFGLGAATEADITVTWPDGSESMQTVEADQQITITQGSE